MPYTWNPFVGNLDYYEANTDLDVMVKYAADDAAAGYLGAKTVAGTGISLAEGTGGDVDKLKITNSAPDQTVSLSNGTGISVTGTYPSFTIANTGIITETDPLSLHLDQTSPQDISNGQPDFLAGLRAGSTNQLSIDASGNILTTGTLGAGATTVDSLTTDTGGITLLGGQDIRPSVNSTTAINIAQADGTDFVVFDSTNKRMLIAPTTGVTGTTPLTVPQDRLHVGGTTTNDVITADIGFNLNPVPKAIDNPTVTPVAGAGIDVGFHYYFVTYYTALGETPVPTPGHIATTTAENAQVNITNIPTSTDYRVIGRRIYRSTTNQSSFVDAKLIADIADNTTTTATDNMADAARTGNGVYFRQNTTIKYLQNGKLSMGFSDGGAPEPSCGFGHLAGSAIANGTATGGSSAMFGTSAAWQTTTANKVTAIGYGTLYSLTTGSDNCALGHSAGYYTVGGVGNVLMGRDAGYYNVSGHYNTYVGGYAGRGLTGTSSFYNVAVGFRAGYVLQSNAAYNTHIGYSSAYSLTTGSYNISIGHDVDLPSNTASGQLNIGNLIYGLGLYAVADTRSSTPVTAGKIGIMVAAPTAYLHLAAGTATAGYSPLKFTSGTLNTTAEAGAVEFLTDDFYGTITTGAARKKFVLDNGTNLVSGDVPYVTTNGRLASQTPVANGTYTVGAALTPGVGNNGTITITNGVISAIQQAT